MEVWLLSLEMCHKGALVSILMPVSTIMHLERSAEPKKKKKVPFAKVFSYILFQLQMKDPYIAQKK